MKNTVCVFVIYDIQNVINRYVGEVLKELSSLVESIYVVCNFPEIAEGTCFVEPYADRIIYRENLGFDSGAYKDVILDYIGSKRLRQYDGLLLTNDTYFAPLYPFREMFEKMASFDCDFWGITRHPGGYNVDLGEFDTHVQSYFLWFKKEILELESFYDFWKSLKYASNKAEAVLWYELGINRFLESLGFKGCAYTDCVNASERFEKGSNPYMVYAYELVADHKIPIIKKTDFYGKNPHLINAIRALDYIDDNCDYDTSLIKDFIIEYQKKGLIGAWFDLDAMVDFAMAHKRIFIYGAGVWGQNADDYLRYKGIVPEGFVVTGPDTGDAMEFSKVDLMPGDGIIIAQEFEDVCNTIKEYVRSRTGDDMIFTPCYP